MTEPTGGFPVAPEPATLSANVPYDSAGIVDAHPGGGLSFRMPSKSPAARETPIECTDDPGRIDLAQLLELYQLTWWAHDRNLDQIRRALAHSRPVISAWDGAQMVGFTRVISDLTYRATIWDVIVRPSHQGRGVGTMMMHRVLDHPDLRTVTYFLLLTKDKHSFYEHLGFHTEPSMAMALRR